MNTQTDKSASREAIVFFDGICGFCNQSVNFLMARDTHRKLKFAPLQGETARERLPENLWQDVNTLVFHRDGATYVRSAAVVRILLTIGGVWSVAGMMLWLIPLPLRDLGYRVVARLRYRIFGKRDACRLPTAEDRGAMLE